MTPTSRLTSGISDDSVKYLNLFGQRLYGSLPTPEISEAVLDQKSPKPFYTTLPHAGDSSYRHFDFSARHQNLSNAEELKSRSYSSKQWGEFQTSSPKFSDYQRTTVSSNTSSSNMLLQRCSSLTELDRETGFREKIQYNKWENYPPNCKSSNKTYQTTIPMKRAADRKSSLSSSVPNLVDAIQKETFQHLNSTRFEKESGATNILNGDTRPVIHGGSMYHEFKSSKNWQECNTANNQKNDLSSFTLYEAKKFANQETTSRLYSSNESVDKCGNFRDDLEVQRSRSSSVLSQSCTDVNQLDMVDDRLFAKISNGGQNSSATSNESRLKHRLAKVPIPSFEEFKFLRSQSLPGGNSIRPYQNTKTETSKKVSDEHLPSTISSATNDAKRNSQYSSIYQRMRDESGKNANSLDHSKSSLSIRNTTTSTIGKERPQLKKNFKSSPVLARLPLKNTFDQENRTTPLNDSHSSENEFSYFSQNEVIHKLMLKYGLYNGHSNKNESSSSPEENYPSENIQEKEAKVTIHNSSESCILDSKLRDSKELARNGVSRVSQNAFVGEEKMEDSLPLKKEFKRQVIAESPSETDKTINHTTATKMKTFNEIILDTKRNSLNQKKEDLKYFSVRENSVKDLYSNSKKISSNGDITNTDNKIMHNSKKASENVENVTSSQKVAEDEAGRFQSASDKFGKHNYSEKPRFYNISRSNLLASKFKMGLSKNARQSNNDDQSEQNTQSPTRTKTLIKAGVNQALERSPTSSSSQPELPADDYNSLFHESNHSVLRRKSFNSSTLSISSIYSAFSSETEENTNELGEGDTLMQDRIRKRGGRKSRWDSFHSDISADSGSCHMFEYETDFNATEPEDDDAERNNAGQFTNCNRIQW